MLSTNRMKFNVSLLRDTVQALEQLIQRYKISFMNSLATALEWLV